MAEDSAAPRLRWHAVEADLGRYGAARIHVREWRAAQPRGVVVILHGVGEHSGRYQRLAAGLVAAGFAVVAPDQLGHGQTALAAAREGTGGLGRLGRGQNRAALRGVLAVLEWAQARYPRVPLILLGHSWGSLLAQQVLARRSALLHALVLSGTALPLPGYLNPGDLDAPWRPDPTGLYWFSRDPEVWRQVGADPLCFDIQVQPAWNALGALQLLQLPPSALTARVDDVPVLILAGSDDTIGYRGRGPRALARVLRRRSALSDVTYREYPGARHEVFNELNHDEVTAELHGWLDRRFPV